MTVFPKQSSTAENTNSASPQTNPNQQDGQVKSPQTVPDHGTKVDELKQQQPTQEKEQTPGEHPHEYKVPVAEKTPGNESSDTEKKGNQTEDGKKPSQPNADQTRPDPQTPDHKL